MTPQKIKEEEFQVSQDIIDGKTTFADNIFFQKCYERLSDLKKLSLEGNFVCIGSGPLPTTLLFAEENFHCAHYIGIDNDIKAVNMSRQLVDYLQIKNITFLTSIKQLPKFSTTPTHFFIANMVKPKKDVLNKVIKMCDEHSYIIIREPMNSSYSENESITEVRPKGLALIDKGVESLDFNSINYIFKADKKVGSRLV